MDKLIKGKLIKNILRPDDSLFTIEIDPFL